MKTVYVLAVNVLDGKTKGKVAGTFGRFKAAYDWAVSFCSASSIALGKAVDVSCSYQKALKVCREAGSVYIGELTGSDGTFMMTRIISTVFNPDTINWDEFLGVNKAGDGNDEKRQATA